jgi:hypothetical protein
MPGVSRERIENARRVDLLSWLLANEPDNLTRKNGEYRLRDHDSLTLSNGRWFWHSRGFGGVSALDFLVKVRGVDFMAAVTTLCGGSVTMPLPQPSPPPRHVPATAFRLPRRAVNERRVYACLLSRGIGKDLIRRCIREGILYESDPYHNAVFVGRDNTGQPRFACARGTLGSHKHDIAGSDKRFGFTLPAMAEVNGATLAVFESPIDALSHAELTGRDCARLSLAGTAPLALRQYLDEEQESARRTTRVELCLDNDEAGHAGMEAIERMLSEDFRFADIEIARTPPTQHKDYNEALLAHQREQRAQQHTQQHGRRHDGGLSL